MRALQLTVEPDSAFCRAQPVAELDVLDRGRAVPFDVEAADRQERLLGHGAATSPESRRLRAGPLMIMVVHQVLILRAEVHSWRPVVVGAKHRYYAGLGQRRADPRRTCTMRHHIGIHEP